jgi:hypothetical protein
MKGCVSGHWDARVRFTASLHLTSHLKGGSDLHRSRRCAVPLSIIIYFFVGIPPDDGIHDEIQNVVNNNSLKIGVAIASSATLSYDRSISWQWRRKPRLAIHVRLVVDALELHRPGISTMLTPPNDITLCPSELVGNGCRPEPTNITAALSAAERASLAGCILFLYTIV